MPVIGLGLHFLLALFCAVHVVRSRQELYWLIILFSFPLLGSLVYFFVIYMPNSRLERSAVKAVSAAAKAIDPGKDVRLARADFEATPTAQNQMRLAAALLESGAAEDAAQHYVAALQGPFASDPNIRFGAASALLECQRFAQAIDHLEELRRTRPEFRPDSVGLLLARAYAGAGRAAESREEFERTIQRYGTFEAYAEYAIWALATGDAALSARLHVQIENMTRRWNAMNWSLNEPVMRRLKAAQQLASKGS